MYSFYEERNPVKRLTYQINACLLAINKFDFQIGDLDELRRDYNKLCNYQNNPFYRNIAVILKRAVKEQINTVTNYLSSIEERQEAIIPECSIQIPSNIDIQSMKGMSAGNEEDQCERLGNIVGVLQEVVKADSHIAIYSTNDPNLPNHWLHLFNAINQGDPLLAQAYFQQIPKDDLILKPLLTVHPESYLLELMEHSIGAQSKNKKLVKLNNDLIVTPRTFEILIRDLALTLANQSPMCFSFGLPTHHAFSNNGAGFCFINKPAVLMNHFELKNKNTPLHYIIVGTDVNRDNGLCGILREKDDWKFTSHIDLFDSRVYPTQNDVAIKKEFNARPIDENEGTLSLYRRNYYYHSVDLNLKRRENKEIHPAIVFALQKLKDGIDEAHFYGRKIVLLFTGGWDAHVDETACCGKYVNNKWMSDSEAQKTRFNDQDFQHFYTEVMAIYMANKDHIKKFYWGLEGGYNKSMYEQQIQLMLEQVHTSLNNQYHPLLRGMK